MTFSIVIPAFNGEKYIEQAILSALKQTRKADEIIVHDDNSSDSTAVICKKYFPEIKYIFNREGPSGFVNGWNRTLRLAKSTFITILHQDDILYPTFLEQAEKALVNAPDSKHLFSLCDYIDYNSCLIQDGEQAVKENYHIGDIVHFSGKEYVNEYQKSYQGITHIHRCPGVITHRSIFESGIYYNPEAGHIADDDFFYRVARHTAVVGIMKSMAAYRVHDDSETGKIGDSTLVTRLSDDYIFQIEQWANSDFMSSDNVMFFVENAFKFSNRLLGYGLRKANIELIRKALINMNRLNGLGFRNIKISINAVHFLLRPFFNCNIK